MKTLHTDSYKVPTVVCPCPQGLGALIPIASKIYKKCWETEYIKKLRNIWPNQSAFRWNRGTAGQILPLRSLKEGVQDKNLTAVRVFVDLKKNKTFDIGRSNGCHTWGLWNFQVKAIMIQYVDIFALMRSPDGDTTFCQVFSGPHQGDTLFPYIFIICLDYHFTSIRSTHRM